MKEKKKNNQASPVLDQQFESDIMDKVYNFEKKRTTTTLVIYIILITISLAAIAYLVFAIYLILRDQQTLDLLDIFHEDSSIIRQYFFEVLGTFYEEFPHLLGVVLAVFVLLLCGTTFFFLKNFGKMKRKFVSVRNHSSKN